MNLQHTQGPWNFHRSYQPMRTDTNRTPNFEYLSISIAAGDKIIAEVTMLKHDPGKECGYPLVDNVDEVVANAKLIVIAPEMLDVLLDLYNTLPASREKDRVEGILAKVAGSERDAG